MYINTIKHNIKKQSDFPFNDVEICNFCGRRFEPGEKFTKVEIQVSEFRGDDEVYYFHPDHYGMGMEKLEKIMPGLYEQRKIDNETRRLKRARRRLRQREIDDDESVAYQMTCR